MDLATLLGSYAFPVVACIAMAWYVKDSSEKIDWQHKNLINNILKKC